MNINKRFREEKNDMGPQLKKQTLIIKPNKIIGTFFTSTFFGICYYYYQKISM